MTNNLTKAVSLGFLVLLTLTCYGQDYRSGLNMNLNVGQYFNDSKRNLDDDNFLGFGIGYQFGNPWGVELNYLEGETSVIGINTDVDFEEWRLDALYHFSPGSVQPYMAFGAGAGDFEATGVGADESQLNLGGGLKLYLNDTFAFRGDVRAIYGIDDDTVDYAASLGLFFQFGRSPQPVEEVVVAVEEPLDSDGDGVINANDRCPDTPPNVSVNSMGCIPDTDSDGVADNRDQCPGSEPGARVDEVGCYIVITETVTIEMEVQFANNSDVVEQEYYSEIAEVATFMREYPQTNVVVEGHTDDRGAADYNQQLSERRARAVANVLITQFNIPANRVSSIGLGETQPIADNNTADGRAANRRVVGVVSASVETRQ